MPYTKEQKHTIREVMGTQRRVLRKKGVRGSMAEKIRLATAMTGLVESNWTNIKGGDADSSGWRQERAQFYPNPNNLHDSAVRFTNEAIGVIKGNPGISAGDLAQAVQRSAFPGRYAEHTKQAQDIVSAYGGSASSRARPRQRERGRLKLNTETIPGQSFEAERDALRRDTILGATMQGRMPAMSEILELGQGLNDLDDIAAKTKTSLEYQPGKKRKPRRGRDSSPGRGPGIPKQDGWHGSKSVGAPLARLAQSEGLDAVSEKRGTVNTASGGMSDHYEGNKNAYAWDLSNGSSPTKEMDRAAMRIAKQLGAGKTWRQMGRAGVLNINKTIDGRTYRFQMLYRTQVGGDHSNHVHFGVSRVG